MSLRRVPHVPVWFPHKEPCMSTPQVVWMKLYKHRWLLLAALLVGIVLLAMFGCQLVPTEKASLFEQRENVSGKVAAAAEKIVDIIPADVTIEAKGKDGTVLTVKQPIATHSSGKAVISGDEDSSQTGSQSWTQSIPLGVKLIMLAIGLALLAALLQMARKKFVSVDTAVKWGDEAMNGMINRVKSFAMTSTDPGTVAQATALAGELEGQRAEWHKT